jgi:hypothetical protein
MHTEEDVTFATCRTAFVVIWHNETSKAGVQLLSNWFAKFVKTQTKGVGLITIVEADAPLPSGRAREDLAKFMADNNQVIKTSVVVFEGTGFRAAAVRSVVTGLTMLARQAFPHKVFSAADVALEWFREQMVRADIFCPNAEELARSIRDMRTELPNRR